MLPLFWREGQNWLCSRGAGLSSKQSLHLLPLTVFFFVCFFFFFYFMHFIYFQICLFYFDIKFSFILGYAQRRLNMIGYILVSDYVLVW